MPVFIKEFFNSLASGWVLTDKGVAVVAGIWAAVTMILTALTNALHEYAPLSYFLGASFGIMLGLHIARSVNRIFEGRYTKTSTYIEYRMENGRINLVSKSNIYKEPSFNLGIHMQVGAPEVPQATSARNQRRVQNKTAVAAQPAVITELDLKTAAILVLFEKPIANGDFHMRIEQGVGTCPVRDLSSMDNRWATVNLSNLANSCSFKIFFN